jgi:hypothetical protein
MAFFINSFAHTTKSADNVALLAEAPQARENIKSAEPQGLKTAVFFVSTFGAAAILVLACYFHKLGGFNFSLSDPKLFSGLLFGGAGVYLLGSDLFRDKIWRIFIAIFGPILAGLIFGPIFLAGVLAGAILIELLVTQNVGAEVLLAAISTGLAFIYIETSYSIITRAIIAGAVVIVIALYLIIRDVYGTKLEARK